MPNTNIPKPSVDFDAGHVPITEEFDSAKRTLPPVAPLAVALIVVLVFILGVAYIFRSKPVAQGQIDRAFAMQQENNAYSMVMMQVTLHNIGDKSLYIKEIKASIVTDQGESTDDAASAVGFGDAVGDEPLVQGQVGERPVLGQPVAGSGSGSYPVIGLPHESDGVSGIGDPGGQLLPHGSPARNASRWCLAISLRRPAFFDPSSPVLSRSWTRSVEIPSSSAVSSGL